MFYFSGNSERLPCLEVLESLEKWIVVCYGGTKRPGTIETISQLRWYLYSKFQCDVEKLPPTAAALKYKIFRSHFVTLVLKRSLNQIQNIPSALNYGWESCDKVYNPIMTDELPAPLALIELSVCGCKTKCTTRRCKCFKNKLPCTDMCKCVDCENDDGDFSDEERCVSDEEEVSS